MKGNVMFFNNGMPDYFRAQQAMERGREEIAAAQAAIKNNQDDRAASGLTPTKAQRVAAGRKQVTTHAPTTDPKKGWTR